MIETIVNVKTEIYSGHRHATLECWFNADPLKITISENDKWFGIAGKTADLNGKSVMLNSSGNGEEGVPRIKGEAMLIETEFGNYRVRPARPEDQKRSGFYYRGLILEKVSGEDHSCCGTGRNEKHAINCENRK